jgi:nucleotide-binding universal stress UspA family protein
MSSIVLTTDLSPESERAFKPAVLLAERLGLSIVLLAVLEYLPFEPTAGGLVSVYPDRGRIHADWSKRLAELTKALGSAVPVRSVLIEAADVPRAIVEFAHKEQAAFLAIATHGRSGLRRFLLGSVAESVLRHAHIPVLVYPPPGGVA